MSSTSPHSELTSDELLAKALEETRYQYLPGGRKKLEALFATAAILGPQRILDVGCGNGGLSFPLAVLGCEVIATDVDPRSVDHCRARNRVTNLRFVETDGTLREIDGRFDLVVCSEVLEHLDDPDSLIAAMHEKLSPRGRILITIPNGYGLREIGGRMERYVRRRLGLERPLAALRHWLSRHGMVDEAEKYRTHTSNPEQGHVQRFTTKEMRRRLGRHGLEVVSWRSSFVILSVFRTRAGTSWVEVFDSWLADRLPLALASGWYIECAPRSRSAAPVGEPGAQ